MFKYFINNENRFCIFALNSKIGKPLIKSNGELKLKNIYKKLKNIKPEDIEN